MSEHTESATEPRQEESETTVARAAVVQALRNLELGERDSMEALHRTLCELVRVLRQAGRSCDEVVADVRSIIARPITPEGERKVPVIAREALVELTLRWCAEEYSRTESH